MTMHCLCKSISTTSSSSAVLPIARRSVGFRRFFSSFREVPFLRTSSAFCKYSDAFCSTDPTSSDTMVALHSFSTFKVSAAAHHSFISIRGLKSAPKRNALRNPNPSTNSSPSFKKGKANAGKDSPANTRGPSKPEQPQKSDFSKPHKAETRRPVKPVQAQNRSSSKVGHGKPESRSNSSQAQSKSSSVPVKAKPIQAKAKSASKQVQGELLVDDEFDEDMDDEEEDSDDIEDEDFDDEDEDLDDEDDEALDDELVEGGEGEEDELGDGDNAFFIDDMLDEEGEGTEDVMLGDGGDGGGVKISQTEWGGRALSMAKGVLEEFGDNFSLYAFKTSFENRIYVRLDKHSDRYGSPSMIEIESFSNIFGKRLEEAGQAGSVPENIALEVSSPGAERVVQVPDQLMRFQSLPMLVRYEEGSEGENVKSSPVVKDSILELVSVETESGISVWKLANVRANREQAGKGRGLTKKQKEWRTELPLSSLRLVRLYMDI